ncbi:hypothetical protein MTO96_050234 [Rhipicephalus appendiculatus]
MRASFKSGRPFLASRAHPCVLPATAARCCGPESSNAVSPIPQKRQKGGGGSLGVHARCPRANADSKHCSEKWVRAQLRATELIIDVASP